MCPDYRKNIDEGNGFDEGLDGFSRLAVGASRTTRSMALLETVRSRSIISSNLGSNRPWPIVREIHILYIPIYRIQIYDVSNIEYRIKSGIIYFEVFSSF